MALNTPTPGLRRLVHDSNQPTKVALAVPAGDVLEVSGDVADQLVAASSHFKDAAATPEAPGGDAPAKKAASKKSAAKKAASK